LNNELSFPIDSLVIVPWDNSDHSLNAIKTSVGLVQRPELIRVVHVAPSATTLEPRYYWDKVEPQSIESCLEAMFKDNIRELNLPQLQFVSLLGDPGSEITRYAKDNDAALIVISTHGRSGLSRFLIGSVTERVVRLAHCPVLVVRGISDENKNKAE
jgi:nucleotide-binding universal stress UspA family protein